MGAALRPLEQENDLKEGLINTRYMIQGARDRTLEWGGENTAQENIEMSEEEGELWRVDGPTF